jgi:hypothetical protein
MIIYVVVCTSVDVQSLSHCTVLHPHTLCSTYTFTHTVFIDPDLKL